MIVCIKGREVRANDEAKGIPVVEDIIGRVIVGWEANFKGEVEAEGLTPKAMTPVTKESILKETNSLIMTPVLDPTPKDELVEILDR